MIMTIPIQTKPKCDIKMRAFVVPEKNTQRQAHAEKRATDTDTRKKTTRKDEKENTYIATLHGSCFTALCGIHRVGVFH